MYTFFFVVQKSKHRYHGVGVQWMVYHCHVILIDPLKRAARPRWQGQVDALLQRRACLLYNSCFLAIKFEPPRIFKSKVWSKWITLLAKIYAYQFLNTCLCFAVRAPRKVFSSTQALLELSTQPPRLERKFHNFQNNEPRAASLEGPSHCYSPGKLGI